LSDLTIRGVHTTPDLSIQRSRPVHGKTAHGLTSETMRRDVARLLDLDPAVIAEDDDLIGHGLDSIGMMRLAGRWRRYGIELKFAEMIREPTLARWSQLVGEQLLAAPAPSLNEVDELAPFALAPMQQAYWIGARERSIGPRQAQYYVEFDGEAVTAERLQTAVHALLSLHPMLRARFLCDARQQIMGEPAPVQIITHDLANVTESERAERLSSLRETLSARPLRVEEGEVFDVRLSVLPHARTRVHLTISMLVADAQSFQIVLNDLAALYAEPKTALGPIGYTFERYLAAADRVEAHATAKAYWQRRIPDLPGAPSLPLAVRSDEFVESRMTRRHFFMTADELGRLTQRCREHALTLPVVLAAAFAEVIGAWSDQPRFLLNLPVFARKQLHPDVGRVVGDFTNLLLLAVDLSETLSFEERARKLHAQLIEAAAHQEYSGVDVLREIAATRPGEWLAAPIVFTSAIGLGDLFAPQVRRCFGRPAWSISQTPQVWLDHQVTELDDGLLFNWDIVDGIFAAGVLDAIWEAYSTSVRWLYAASKTWADAIPAKLPARQEAARVAVNATSCAFSDDVLHQPFFSRARKTPGSIALAGDVAQQRTYGELADNALTIAGLLREQGVSPGDVVAITMDRGPDQIAAVLGALATGATFVPVSSEHPPQRRAKIYRDAGALLVLTRHADRNSIELSPELRVVEVESADPAHRLDQPVAMSPESLAYIIYTSGSTGEPKGVEISHAAAMNTIFAINAKFGVGPRDRVLAVASLDFDLSIYDIFGLFAVGGTVVLLDETMRLEARNWIRLARAFGVTIWNSVPALLEMLLAAAEADGWPSSLRLVLVSGDWVAPHTAERVKEHAPECRFIALGGATEASIWSNALEVDCVDSNWRSVPYGFPLANQRFRVVDYQGRDCPDYVPGELWIGGKGLARGYRGDALQSALRFVHQQGERWYRTGDRGRYLPGAMLEFLGRTDLQVKIKGHRVELGEVEAALQSHPGVSRAVAVMLANETPRLAAAVVPAFPLQVSEVNAAVAAKVPRYMIPDRIILIEQLPLTTNGKVDRSALGAAFGRPDDRLIEERPHGKIQNDLARLWATLLNLESIGPQESFFALGGTSVLATRMVEAISKQFGIDVTLKQLLTTPTLAEVALLISESDAAFEEGVI
jgi:yersiniabactin nonribosomal peptide synthetase